MTTVQVRASGPYACFTHPVFKVERVSYQVITPSAARGLLESILWKPEMRWRILSIAVLNPIAWFEYRGTELKTPGHALTPQMIASGNVRPFYADEHRTQRSTQALRDVDYVITAMPISCSDDPENTSGKYHDMFVRRLMLGQHYQQPYFGIREFVADVRPVEADPPRPIPISADLGAMLWDIDYSQPGRRAQFFHARMNRGIVDVPERPDY